METLHGCFPLFSNGLPVIINNNNLVPKFNLEKVIEPVRHARNLSKWTMIRNMIIRWGTSKGRYNLAKELARLPKEFIQMLYEFGLEIITLMGIENEQEAIPYHNRKIRMELKPYQNMKKAGVYVPVARLIVISEKVLNLYQNRPIFFYIGKCYEHALVSNPHLLNVPDYAMSYQNKFCGHLVIRYALSKGRDYFAKNLEDYFHPQLKIQLKQKDRIMYRLMEHLLENHFSDQKPVNLFYLKEKMKMSSPKKLEKVR